jgi:hypothetical protein
MELPDYARLIRRNLEGSLRRAARQMPVVAVTGPRQSGKTTLCRQVFGDRPYVSLEPLDRRNFAARDPRGFLAELREGAVIDEVQRVPELLSYLQEEVDERPQPGRFVLTGSQQLGLGEAVSQSLAGRIALLHLLPPSFDELLRFGGGLEDLWRVVWTGAYPRIHHRGLDPGPWLADYITTYVQRDVRQVLNVGDLTVFASFLRLLAGRTACEVNLSRLAGDVGVSHHTVRSWVSVLETSFVCFTLPAWRRNLRKQEVKSPKLHLVDTGLACSLLGITHPDQLRHHPLRGALFESWLAGEALKSRLHRGLAPRLFHFRDAKGLEVDLVLEEGGRVVLAEAKSGATLAADFFTPPRRLRALLAETAPELAVDARVVYGGEARQQRSDALALPWRAVHEVDW